MERIYKYIDDHKDEIIQELIEVASIKSVSDNTSDIQPFGQGCIDALECMLEKGNKHGFETQNYDNYVGRVSMPNKSKESIGVWAHLDVVPEGDNWMSDPYTPVIRDGFLFGRGVSDNKSAAIGTLYILKALKELNIETKHNIELYCGTSEETGMEDIEHFVNHYKCPKFSFVPDMGFPGSCGEFGRVRYQLVSKDECSDDIIDLYAGEAFNIIPSYAYAILKNIDLDLNNIPESIKVTIEDTIKIEAFGTSKHAAAPEGAINAIHELTKFLSNLNINEKDKEIFKFLTKVNDEPYGHFLNINKEDEIGQTVSSGTILRLKDKKVSLGNDCRHCVSDTNERLVNNLHEKAKEYNFEIIIDETSKPYYLDKNSLPIQTIKKVFTEYTGIERDVFVSKGGTYAGQLPNAFATGIVYGGYDNIPEYIKPGHGGPHQPDELLPIDGFIEGIKLFAKILLTVDEVL